MTCPTDSIRDLNRLGRTGVSLCEASDSSKYLEFSFLSSLIVFPENSRLRALEINKLSLVFHKRKTFHVLQNRHRLSLLFQVASLQLFFSLHIFWSDSSFLCHPLISYIPDCQWRQRFWYTKQMALGKVRSWGRGGGWHSPPFNGYAASSLGRSICLIISLKFKAATSHHCYTSSFKTT